MTEIKHSYVFDKAGKLIHISEVTPENRYDREFFCIQCGERMLPRLGNSRRHHFYHAIETSCDGESYLHKLAKILLKERFDNSDSFPIEFRRTLSCVNSEICPFCSNQCVEDRYESFDLKDYYDTCQEEQSVGDYVADLLLSDSTGRYSQSVLIEILVTHRCVQEKVDSGLKIIEIPVKSEEDIMNIISSPLREMSEAYFHGWEKEPDGNARFYGMGRKSSKKTELISRYISRFVLFENGSMYVSNYDDLPSCSELHNKRNRNSVLELNVDADLLAPVSPYELGIVKAIDLGFNVKSCTLCKYHRSGFDHMAAMPIFCCMSKKYGTPIYPDQKEAQSCQYYYPDQTRIETIRDEMKKVPITVVES